MEKNILAFGDSNTWGYVPGGDGKRFKRDERWSGRLGTLLGKEYHIIEEGLNSRTTVHEDPVKGDKSGLSYIVPCLQSHKPLDLVILMLGSNDCKERFACDPYSIASGLSRVLDAIIFSRSGRREASPAILLIAPPWMREGEPVPEMGEGAVFKSRQLADAYRQLADEYGCRFLDGEKIHSASEVDCLHLDLEGHHAFASRIAREVKDMME